MEQYLIFFFWPLFLALWILKWLTKTQEPVEWWNEIIVITGGSQGLGKEIVLSCLKRNPKKIVILDLVRPDLVQGEDNVTEKIKSCIINATVMKS